MTDFQTTKPVKAIRKPAFCEHCNTMIDVGSPAIKTSGSYEGDFYSVYCHPECEAAGTAYATMTGYWGEEFQRLHELDSEDWPWIIEEHPAVAIRMNLTERLNARVLR